jgi:uncharacterized RDD family membrane protein YckC
VTLPPQGWYADPVPPPTPGLPPVLRFWNGQQWTEHIAAPPTGNQYPPAVPVPTTPDGVPLASWWSRAGAYVIDAILLGAVNAALTLPFQLQMQSKMQDLMAGDPEPGEFLSAYLDLFVPLLRWSALIGFVTWAIYNAVMLRHWGTTVGKMVLGLAVRLRERPGQLPWSTIAVRILAQHGYVLTGVVVPVLYLALFWYPWLDCLWASWDAKKQALHDKAARTNVVRTR